MIALAIAPVDSTGGLILHAAPATKLANVASAINNASATRL
jgi:hypothetical protein